MRQQLPGLCQHDDPRRHVSPRASTAARLLPVILVLTASAGCATSTPASSPGDPCSGGECNVTSAVPQTPQANPAEPVTLVLRVHSVPEDYGLYLEYDHANPSKVSSFNTGSDGNWSHSITVPSNAVVQLNVANASATCEISSSAGTVLTRGGNGCLIGSVDD